MNSMAIDIIFFNNSKIISQENFLDIVVNYSGPDSLDLNVLTKFPLIFVLSGEVVFDTDEHPRPTATIEQMAKLPSVFKKGGTVTAANASVSWWMTANVPLVVITGTTILVPHAKVKSLQLIWRWGTRRFHLRVPDIQMCCRDLITRQGASIIATTMATRGKASLAIVILYRTVPFWRNVTLVEPHKDKQIYLKMHEVSNIYSMIFPKNVHFTFRIFEPP